MTVAVYFLNLKTFGRAGGSSAVRASAYRAGERMRDERTGNTYDHSERLDVLHKEIVLPSQFSDDDMLWARNRNTLWNAAEHSESRANARVAREYLVALPMELSRLQRSKLATQFSKELADRYGFAVDLAVHEPRDLPGNAPPGFHAHLLATTREVRLNGLGAKTALEWSDGNRRNYGLPPVINELLHVRARWATVTNEALEEAGVSVRVDHRTLRAKSIDRELQFSIPRAPFEMQGESDRSDVTDRHRKHEREIWVRPEAERAQAAPAQFDGERAWTREIVAQGREPAAQPENKLTPDNIRSEARENWLRHRQQPDASPSADAAKPVSRDSDLTR